MSIKIRSDEEIKEEARKKFREMLGQKSFAERGKPLWSELLWVIKGRENEAKHQRILPDYCYHIFELYKRTTFKVLSTFSETVTITGEEVAMSGKTVEKAGQRVTINWENVGSFVGMGLRAFQYLDVELEGKLRQEGLLDFNQDQCEDLVKLFLGSDWQERKTAEIQAQEPGKTVEEVVEKKLTALEESIKESVSKSNQFAYECGPEAMTQLNRGMARGTSGFLDEKGELIGEHKVKLIETYGFLLVA